VFTAAATVWAQHTEKPFISIAKIYWLVKHLRFILLLMYNLRLRYATTCRCCHSTSFYRSL